MNANALAAWIDQHDRPEPTRINDNGTLTVASYVCTEDSGWIEFDTIPATFDAASKLLGY